MNWNKGVDTHGSLVAGGSKMDFLLCIVKYVIEMAILLGIGILGAFIGIKLRRRKDAKTAALADETKE